MDLEGRLLLAAVEVDGAAPAQSAPSPTTDPAKAIDIDNQQTLSPEARLKLQKEVSDFLNTMSAGRSDNSLGSTAPGTDVTSAEGAGAIRNTAVSAQLADDFPRSQQLRSLYTPQTVLPEVNENGVKLQGFSNESSDDWTKRCSVEPLSEFTVQPATDYFDTARVIHDPAQDSGDGRMDHPLSEGFPRDGRGSGSNAPSFDAGSHYPRVEQQRKISSSVSAFAPGLPVVIEGVVSGSYEQHPHSAGGTALTSTTEMVSPKDRKEEPGNIRTEAHSRRHTVDGAQFSRLPGRDFVPLNPSLDSLGALKQKCDHTPHELFIQLDELQEIDQQLQWKEKARWIKYEENVQEGSERWGLPHVPSLSFHSLLDLRNCINQGSVILDLKVNDMHELAFKLVGVLLYEAKLPIHNRNCLLDVLLLRHTHSAVGSFMHRNNLSWLSGLDRVRRSSIRFLQRRMTPPGSIKLSHSVDLQPSYNITSNPPNFTVGSFDANSIGGEMNNSSNTTPAGLQQWSVNIENGAMAAGTTAASTINGQLNYGYDPEKANDYNRLEENNNARRYSKLTAPSDANVQLMKQIPEDAETTSVLVGNLDELDQPVMAFVRLATGIQLEGLTEVSLPVRFVFLLLGPKSQEMNYYQIGRSIATLLANKKFHRAAYQAEDRADLLAALNEFLDDTLVLPPSKVNKNTLIPILEDMKKKAAEKRLRKLEKAKEQGLITETTGPVEPIYDPLRRTGRLFGGMINDIKIRYPQYWSDIKDALNIRSLAVIFFIFFACITPAITFGALMGKKTQNWMSVTEMLLATFITGTALAIFGCQPLLIIGATGPVQVFEVALFQIANSAGIDFMAWRFWVCVWITVICTVLVALEGSFLVRYFTRFFEDIFSTLISIIFIGEVFKAIIDELHKFPITGYHSVVVPSSGNQSYLKNSTMSYGFTSEFHTSPYFTTLDFTTQIPFNASIAEFDTVDGMTTTHGFANTTKAAAVSKPRDPRTSLLTILLIFATFAMAISFRFVRNSKFLGRTMRKYMGDFGVPITIIVMTLIDIFVIKDNYTNKLNVPNGLVTTRTDRSWYINPMGVGKRLPVWAMFMAIGPAIMCFVILFMEQQISSVIVNQPERKLTKGTGYHSDCMLMGIFAFLSGILGFPLMCAATVRAIIHVQALTTYSKTHAPGVRPEIEKVNEQRVTAMAVHILIGLSILLSPVLRLIPMSVLYGIFLYIGLTSLQGVEMIDRCKLLFMPVKYHPNEAYVQKVRTYRMHIFTVCQLFFFGALWAVKQTVAAIAFPAVLIVIVIFRKLAMPLFFTPMELSKLDRHLDKSEDTPEEKAEAALKDLDDSEDEEDEYLHRTWK